jgi:hypothetical protein
MWESGKPRHTPDYVAFAQAYGLPVNEAGPCKLLKTSNYAALTRLHSFE